MTEKAKSWVKICPLDQIPQGKASNVYINGQRLVMTRTEKTAYVLQGYCSHMLFFLKDAEVDDCVLTCSLHNSQFDIRDGTVVHWTGTPSGPMLDAIKEKKRLRTYETRVEDDIVFLAWATDKPESVRVRF